MIRKTEKLVITFYTTTAAMAMEKICKEYGADGRTYTQLHITLETLVRK